MTWLVTGATGRVGTSLTERLAGRVPLRLLVRGDLGASRERLRTHFTGAAARGIASGEISLASYDLARPGLGQTDDELGRAVAGVTGILHLAALTDFSDFTDSAAGLIEDRHHRVNVTGALEIAALAARAHVPLVFVSTAYLSGDHPGTFRETDRDLGQRFHNPYERSKAEAERCLQAFCRAYGVPLTIYRLGIVLPDAPRAGIETGPGPLVFLEFLAGLQGRGKRSRRASASDRAATIRYPGDETACLNLVTLDQVSSVLESAIDRANETSGVYHVTARRPTRIGDLSRLVNEHVPEIALELVADREMKDPDQLERMLAKHCRPYQPYLFVRTLHDRSRFERDFTPGPDPDDATLRDIFAAHVDAWRAARGARRAPTPARATASSIAEYFDTFLPHRMGSRLVPGLETLSAEFTVSVPQVGIYLLRIENGVLAAVTRADRASVEIDYESEASALLEAVAGLVRPSELFFQRRVTIRGDLYRALSTATALEEFFRLHPFAANRPA